MCGAPECGAGPRMQVLTGATLTTTTTPTAGHTTRVTGIMRTTATTTTGDIAKMHVCFAQGPAKSSGPCCMNWVHFPLRLIQHFKVSVDLPGGMKIRLGQITNLTLRGNLYVPRIDCFGRRAPALRERVRRRSILPARGGPKYPSRLDVIVAPGPATGSPARAALPGCLLAESILPVRSVEHDRVVAAPGSAPRPGTGSSCSSLLASSSSKASTVIPIFCHGYSFPTLPRLPATLLPTSSQKLGVLAAWVSFPSVLSAAFEDAP